jgi:hypothetical protein
MGVPLMDKRYLESVEEANRHLEDCLAAQQDRLNFYEYYLGHFIERFLTYNVGKPPHVLEDMAKYSKEILLDLMDLSYLWQVATYRNEQVVYCPVCHVAVFHVNDWGSKYISYMNVKAYSGSKITHITDGMAVSEGTPLYEEQLKKLNNLLVIIKERHCKIVT